MLLSNAGNGSITSSTSILLSNGGNGSITPVISILLSNASDGSVTSATSILLSNAGEGSPSQLLRYCFLMLVMVVLRRSPRCCVILQC